MKNHGCIKIFYRQAATNWKCVYYSMASVMEYAGQQAIAQKLHHIAGLEERNAEWLNIIRKAFQSKCPQWAAGKNWKKGVKEKFDTLTFPAKNYLILLKLMDNEGCDGHFVMLFLGFLFDTNK